MAKLTFVFPVSVFYHRAWSWSGPNGNSPSMPNVFRSAENMFQYIPSSIPPGLVGVWQGLTAFSIAIGMPDKSHDDIKLAPSFSSSPSGADIQLRTSFPISVLENNPDGVGQNNMRTAVNNLLAAYVPSQKPTSFITRMSALVTMPLTEAQIAKAAETGVAAVPASIPLAVIRDKAMMICQEMMAQINSSINKGAIKLTQYSPYVEASADVSIAPFRNLSLSLNVDTETGEISLSEVEFTDEMWQADVELINQQLLTQTRLYLAGDITDLELVIPTRPPSTFKSSVRAKLDEWWDDVMAAYQDLRRRVIQLSSGRTAANTSGTSAAYVRDKIAAATRTSTGSSTWANLWGSVKTTIGAAAGSVWDTISDWGPKEIAMGYAGVTAVNSAKNSSIPPWMIIGGGALAAIAILK